MHYYTLLYNTIQYNTIQYNTIQYITINIISNRSDFIQRSINFSVPSSFNNFSTSNAFLLSFFLYLLSLNF